jgi:ribonuclease J
MAKIKLYGGVNEIGGTKILLESEKEGKIFLDFGRSFSQERQFFDPPFLQPREEKHLLSLNILPRLPGLYKQDTADCEIEGILISHAHTDHFDYVRYVKDTIPIFCHRVSREIILSREYIGQPPSREYAIAVLNVSEGEVVEKKILSFKSGEKFTLGGFEVEPVGVDHSIPGACAYIIRTPDGNIVYTGDFRMHGTRQDLTFSFLEKAREANPKVLLIEGTSLLGGRCSSEEEVFGKSLKVVGETKGIVFVSFSPVDFDRLQTFYNVACETGRVLAISTRQAFYLDKLARFIDLQIDLLKSDNILIYARAKEKPRTWEKHILSCYHSKIVEAAEIKKEQHKIILVYSYYDMNEMEDISPLPGSVFILSQSEPFNEEMELDYKKLLNWLEFYGIPLYNIHASGHALPFELKRTVEEISPEVVFPIHTNAASLYKRFLSDLKIQVVLPEVGREYIVQ